MHSPQVFQERLHAPLVRCSRTELDYLTNISRLERTTSRVRMRLEVRSEYHTDSDIVGALDGVPSSANFARLCRCVVSSEECGSVVPPRRTCR